MKFKCIRDLISSMYYIIQTNIVTLWEGNDVDEIPHRFDDRNVICIEGGECCEGDYICIMLESISDETCKSLHNTVEAQIECEHCSQYDECYK